MDMQNLSICTIVTPFKEDLAGESSSGAGEIIIMCPQGSGKEREWERESEAVGWCINSELEGSRFESHWWTQLDIGTQPSYKPPSDL